ncbi:fungal-specific transcription factor domain-containing protein [Paraphoma chrysanthemicola]|uniref:Fungal-specific transcription factor domain-containing protein n=1 Tax=Paraphoma chrysanthemicola TaxID=798071 RepID=A0A8K0R9U2_9PLEO|nr:fungal-specific transcription factor domain-containing protein [Paraphoma chrysanthemicola]
MSSMITFAANNEFFRKRKRVHRACESCKKRRKRCSHTFDGEEDGSSTQSGHAPNPTSDPHGYATNGHHHHDHRGHRVDSHGHGYPNSSMAPPPQSPASEKASKTPPNFLGYLNPEAVLREQVHSERGKGGQSAPSPMHPPIGQWIEEADQRSASTTAGSASSRLNETGPHSTQELKVSRALQQYLDAVGVDILPSRKSQDVLLDIYFAYVHPLLPLVDKDLFYEQYEHGREPRLLMQAICIVASKHADAASYLALGDDPNPLTPREFSQRLYNAVIIGIEAKLEKNRVVLIQVLALISLHCEGPEGAEQSSMHLAQAIHHAHTFGLQFGHQWKNQSSESQGNLEDVFWVLWSLDKINACMNGRPLLMHDRDNSLRQLPSDPEKRSSPFGIWLQISEMLDKVIDYYRPGRSAEETGWEGDDFLGFEEMVGDGEDKLDGPIMSLLSMFHHTMCMASHKSLSINAPVKSSPSYVRQSLSATRVIHLLNADTPERLPPLPIVPYALGVALSVVYRHFRSRRLKVHVNRATEELKQCVRLLDRLRNAWWSAGTMADLGRAVLSNAAGRSTNAANTPATVPAEPHQPETKTEPPTPTASHNGNLQPPNQQHWPQSSLDTQIDPRLQHNPSTPMTNLLNPMPAPTPGQHPTSSERAPMQAPPNAAFGFAETSPDWLNFDTAFENFEGLLGSSGADLSNELFRPLGYEAFEGFLDPAA